MNFSISNVAPGELGSVALQPRVRAPGCLECQETLHRHRDSCVPSRSASPRPLSQTGDDAVLEAFHILNNFDIPKGAARDREKDSHGNIVADYTLWTSVNDLKRMRFYFRT